MKTVLLTGATGFLGRHVYKRLSSLEGLAVLGTAKSRGEKGFLGNRFIRYHIGGESVSPAEVFGCPDVLIHLAWDGLPNYNEKYHFEKNLMNHYYFLKEMINAGVKSVVVAGTCYEYGLKNGCLSESEEPSPVTAYGVAKDALRRFLEQLRTNTSYTLKWLRLFFTYGEGQNPNSLIPQLERAIASGRKTFEMSGGEQLRDYLPVEQLADIIVRVSLQNRVNGIINVCSGLPISVRRLVENYLESKSAHLEIKLGVYPYPSYEPMAFWGEAKKLKEALRAFDNGD